MFSEPTEQSKRNENRLAYLTKLSLKTASPMTSQQYRMMPDGHRGSAHSLSAILLPDSFLGDLRQPLLPSQPPRSWQIVDRFSRNRNAMMVMEKLRLMRESWRRKSVARAKAKLFRANMATKVLWNPYANISPDTDTSLHTRVAGDIGVAKDDYNNYIVTKRKPYTTYAVSNNIRGSQRSNSYSKSSSGSQDITRVITRNA